jgi:hypothetical protein
LSKGEWDVFLDPTFRSKPDALYESLDSTG